MVEGVSPVVDGLTVPELHALATALAPVTNDSPSTPTNSEALAQLEARVARPAVASIRPDGWYGGSEKAGLGVRAGRWKMVSCVGIAAAVAIGFFAIKYLPNIIHTTQTPTFQTKTYTTTPGQRANITLSDGSQLMLGPVTTLTLTQSADAKGAVHAELNGEALFTVSHSATRPFTVRAQGVTTSVLGTQFVVRAYDASRIRVAVRAGRVSVQSSAVTASNAVAVSMGSAATIAADGLPVVTQIEDLATDFAWADGELVLRDVPLGEALARLSRWYGMEFRVDDPSLLKLDVEATFPARFSPQNLHLFADMLGARITRSGTVVTISRRQ